MGLVMAASGAESDGSDDSERYGSGCGSRDPDRVSAKDLPKWSAKRGDYPEWQWEAASIFEAAKLGDDANQAHEVMSRHMPGDDTCADALTKPLDRKRFVRLREYMMGQYRKSGGPAAK